MGGGIGSGFGSRVLLFISEKAGTGVKLEIMVHLIRKERLTSQGATVVGVVSTRVGGDVATQAALLGVPFVSWNQPFDRPGYQHWVKLFLADTVAFLGWPHEVTGLELVEQLHIPLRSIR